MFERAFQWTVRSGSRVLFAVAVLLFVFTSCMDAWNAAHESYSPRDMALVILGGMISGLRIALAPLIAAIALEHFRARVGHTDT